MPQRTKLDHGCVDINQPEQYLGTWQLLNKLHHLKFDALGCNSHIFTHYLGVCGQAV